MPATTSRPPGSHLLRAIIHLTVVAGAWQAALRDRASRSDRDAGYTTETVIVTALLAAAALAVVAAIVAKVTARANSITL